MAYLTDNYNINNKINSIMTTSFKLRLQMGFAYSNNNFDISNKTILSLAHLLN